MLGCLSLLIVIAASIASGLGIFSFWWVLIPIFFAGSFGITNGPHYERVLEENQNGSITYFPMILIGYCISALVIALIVYGLILLIN